MATHVLSRAETRRGLSFVLLAAVLWGTSGVATKTIYALSDVSTITVAAFRLTLGAPILLAAFRYAGYTNGYRSFRIARTDLAWLLLAGAALGASHACYTAAIPRVGVAISTLVAMCSAPVLVCLFSAALLRERLTRAVGVALAGALIGTVLLIGVGQDASGQQTSAAVGGVLLALGAGSGFAAFMMVSRLLAKRYHPLLSITVAMTISALLLLAVTAVTAGVTLHYPWRVWGLFLYLGLVPSALGYALFYHGVQHTTASAASIASLAEPLTSTVLALVLFGEQLGPLGLLGAALLIGAIAFLYRSDAVQSG